MSQGNRALSNKKRDTEKDIFSFVKTRRILKRGRRMGGDAMERLLGVKGSR